MSHAHVLDSLASLRKVGVRLQAVNDEGVTVYRYGYVLAQGNIFGEG